MDRNQQQQHLILINLSLFILDLFMFTNSSGIIVEFYTYLRLYTTHSQNLLFVLRYDGILSYTTAYCKVCAQHPRFAIITSAQRPNPVTASQSLQPQGLHNSGRCITTMYDVWWFHSMYKFLLIFWLQPNPFLLLPGLMLAQAAVLRHIFVSLL